MKRFLPFLITLVVPFLFVNKAISQSLVDNPCSYSAANEFQDGDCASVTTAGMTSLLDITSCGTGAVSIDDGWFWYDGTGTGANTITFTPDPGFDAIIQVLEGTDLNPCSGFYYGDCSDNAGAGGAETVIGGGVSGIRYIVIIENVGSNTTMTGTVCMTENAPTCTDGIQNQGETGVDCGGPCPYGCPPPTTNSQSSCTSTVNTTVDVITCDLIGTPGFNETVGDINFASNTSTMPTLTGCTVPSGPKNGTWAVYDPLTGVNSASFNTENIVGTKDIYYAFYQGSCASLSMLDCGTMITISGVNASLQSVNISGIDDTQPLYLFMYSRDPFSFTGTLQGFGGTPANDVCGSAEAATGPGCNAGATPSTFIPPSNYLSTICSGGTWYSNENTVYYSFTPDSTSATLNIEGIECNDGYSGGTAQFGVWTSCAAISLSPTLANGFLGCAVGTTPLSLSGLTVGQTYYIVVDGNAGSVCSWDFTATGIILPISLIEFKAELKGGNVDLTWKTEKEVNNDYFTIEKSKDGFNYEVVEVVKGAGTSSISLDYSARDRKPYEGLSYYRLKQTDYDGTSTYSEVTAINIDKEIKEATIYPNPTDNKGYLMFSASKESEKTVSIFDISGRNVFEKTYRIEEGLNKLDISTELLSNGMYYVRLNDQNSTVLKLIKD